MGRPGRLVSPSARIEDKVCSLLPVRDIWSLDPFFALFTSTVHTVYTFINLANPTGRCRRAMVNKELPRTEII
jgi:hypothetical protein